MMAQLNSRPLWTSLLLLLPWLAGCGAADDTRFYRYPPGESPAEVTQRLSVHGLSSSHPAGVLLDFTYYGRLGFCSASHLRRGRVITNAHCVAGIASDLHIVYFDKTGTRRTTPVLRIAYRSSPMLDVALLDLPEEAADAWQFAGSTISPTADQVGRRLGDGSFPVTLWSFDPVVSTAGASVHFHPRKCTGFRARPIIDGVRADGSSERVEYQPIDTDNHLLFDACDSPVIQGNSGALVTVRDDMTKPVGVLHALRGRPVSELNDAYERIEYTGSDGRKTTLTIRPTVVYQLDDGRRVPIMTFFNLGTALDSLLGLRPGLL